MASPEANGAALGASGISDSVVEDLSGTRRGWKKKSFAKKPGTPKRKDVSYIAPNGEEIKSRKHLLKYLKAHPGGVKAGDFCWTSVEAPRRSARLNRKPGRHIRFEELEMFPTKRRKRNINGDAKDNTVKSGRGKKPGGKLRAKGDLALVAKEEPVEMEMEMPEASVAPACNLRSSTAESEELEIKPHQSMENLDESQLDSQMLVEEVKGNPEEIYVDVKNVEAGSIEEAIVLDEHISLSIVPISLKTPAEEIDASDVPVEETQPSDAVAGVFEVAEIEVDDGAKMETPVVLSQPLTVVETVVAEMNGEESPKTEQDESDVAVEDVDIALVDATIDSITATILVEEPNDDLEPDVKNTEASPEDDNLVVEEIMKEEIVDFVTEEPLEEEIVGKVIEMDIDMLNVDEMTTTVQVKEGLIDTKAVDLPQPQGIHALVNDTVTLGGKAKPQSDNELVAQVSLQVSERLLEPIGVLQ